MRHRGASLPVSRFAVQPVSGEPAAHGFVVELEARVGCGKAEQVAHNACEQHLRGCCVGRIAYPAAQQGEHYGILRDVERIGYVAEELAGLGRAPRGDAPRPHEHNHGEEKQYAGRLVHAVPQPVRLTAHARHGKQHHKQQAAPQETAAHADFPPHAREQQPRKEREQQPRETYRQLGRGKSPAAHHSVGRARALAERAEHVPAEGHIEREERRSGHEQRQQPPGEAAYEERIDYVGEIFEIQRPAAAVYGAHLRPAAHVHRHRNGYHEQPEERHHEELAHGRFAHEGEHVARAEVEEQQPHERGEHYHGVQAHEPALEESPRRHAVPAVVVGIAHHVARKDEKEVHRQVAVVDWRRGEAEAVHFKVVVEQHDCRRNAAQAVENLVARLRG